MGEAKLNRQRVECLNPHWLGNEPAWDIRLSNGQLHRDVTQRELAIACRELVCQGKLHPYSAHIDVVRQYHIDAYDTYHTALHA